MTWNRSDFWRLVNLYNGRTNIYYSIYSFTQIYSYREPDYESARIDKIYFDIDIQDMPSGPHHLNGNYAHLYRQAMKLHQFLWERDLAHTIIFSGGGFNFYVFASQKHIIKHKKDCLWRVHRWFLHELAPIKVVKPGEENLWPYIDSTVIGDVAQIARVPGTFNKNRGRWCVSLTREELLSGMDVIFDIASKQRDGFVVVGNKLFSLKPFDRPVQKTRLAFIDSNKKRVGEKNQSVFEYLSEVGIELEEIPTCIEHFLNTPKLNYNERWALIVWLMDNMLTLEETCQVLYHVLDPVYFAHCVSQKGAPWKVKKKAGACERQPQFIYKKRDRGREYYLSCGNVAKMGWCVGIEECRLKGRMFP